MSEGKFPMVKFEISRLVSHTSLQEQNHEKIELGGVCPSNDGSELTLQCMLKCHSEPINFPLTVSPGKEMGHLTRQRKKSPTSARIERTNFGFDRPLLYRLSYEARRDQVVCNYGGNWGNVNVNGTKECCAASTMNRSHRSELTL